MKQIVLKKLNGGNRDYTLHTYEKCEFIAQKVVQSLFNGSQFISCIIKNCDFSRCDYEGMNIVNNLIKSTKYINADIKSVAWENCVIEDCSFDNAYISNNMFANCKFINCSFGGSAFLNNTVKDSEFDHCLLEGSTFSLSKFEKCSFISTNLGNCSFYKNILDSCSYIDVSLNIDSLGQIIGLRPDIINNLSYIFLGKQYGNIEKFGVEKLDSVFKQRGWIFEEILLKYNLEKISNYALLIEMGKYIKGNLESNIIIKQDELEYLIMIIKFFKIKKQLPLFGLIYLYDLISGNLNQISFSELNTISIQFFMNQIAMITNEMLDEFNELAHLRDINDKQEIAIHYENLEIIDFSNLINELNYHFNLGMSVPAELVEIRNGTFIEIILSIPIGIVALQFCLYGINGILLQLIDMKAKIKTLTSKKAPKEILSLTRSGKQIMPETCNLILNGLKNKHTAKLFSKYADKLMSTHFIFDEDNDLP